MRTRQCLRKRHKNDKKYDIYPSLPGHFKAFSTKFPAWVKQDLTTYKCNCYNLPPMPRLLHPISTWIAAFLLVFGNLLPPGMSASGISATDICTSSDQQPELPTHAHCMHCGTFLPLTLDLPNSQLAPLQTTLAYTVKSASQTLLLATRRYGKNWARAPPA